VLTAQLISPSSSINVTQNKFFNFSAKVTCSGGECGYLNATLDPVGWWDSNWIYRMAINITEMNNTNLTGFQVNLSVNTSGPIAAGRMNGDCSDIRFVDNASNVLPFYLDTGCNTTSTKVWVRLNLSANSSSIIYIYYGNPSASSSANGTATFEFFDDFNSASVDTSKWFVGGGMTQSGGVVSGVNSGTDYLFGKTRININTLTYIRMRDKSTSSSARPGVLNNTGNPFSVIGFGWQDYQDGYRYTDTYDSAVNQVQHNLFNTSWFALETIWTANNVTFIVNGSVLGVHTAQVPVSTRILYGQVDGNAEYDLFILANILQLLQLTYQALKR